MHREAFGYIAQQVKELPPRKHVVEFGGLDINGSVRSLFTAAKSYVSVDPQAGRGVDVVMDALDYTPEKPVDTVVCCEVLEHAEHGGGTRCPCRRHSGAGRRTVDYGGLRSTNAT